MYAPDMPQDCGPLAKEKFCEVIVGIEANK